MYFRVTLPALQDGKKDEAVSFVKERVMTEFDNTPGLLSMTAAITGDTTGINIACYESKESMEAVIDQIQGILSEAADLMACLLYTSDAADE